MGKYKTRPKKQIKLQNEISSVSAGDSSGDFTRRKLQSRDKLLITDESPTSSGESNFPRSASGAVSGGLLDVRRPNHHQKSLFHGNQKIRTKRHIILTIYAITLLASLTSQSYYSAQAAPPAPQSAPSSIPVKVNDNNNLKISFGESSDSVDTVGPSFSSSSSLFASSLIPETEDSESDTEPVLSIPVKNCTKPSADDFPQDLFSREARRHGAIAIHFIVSVYLFYALLLVCDEYFVPSVESICRDLRIPSDVAGATFMAISTSAPELFTNIIGTFVTKGDMGVGTIVGSAVFNILAVGACCGLGAGYAVQKLANPDDKIGIRLEWWPLTRDSIFYLLSVAALITVLSNRRVYWTEALFMLIIYALYVLALCFNTPLKNWAEGLKDQVYILLSIDSGENPRRISVVVGKFLNINERTPLLLQVTEKGEVCPPEIDGEVEPTPKPRKTSNLDSILNTEYDIPADSLDKVLIYNALSRSNSFCQQETDDCSGLCNLPKEWDWKVLIEWIISWPIRFALSMTIPDCRLYRFRKWYWVTLAMCVAWIGALSYVISWMVTIIGDTLSIPDSVTGLTFLAAGTSIPEVLSSLIVARQGLGSMGFSNTIGSNTFDVLVCLGLPWLIQTIIISSEEVNYIEIQSGGLEYSTVLLVSALVILYLFIALNGFILDRKIGFSCVVMYAIFISFACMLEMNVFFPVNLPPC